MFAKRTAEVGLGQQQDDQCSQREADRLDSLSIEESAHSTFDVECSPAPSRSGLSFRSVKRGWRHRAELAPAFQIS